MFSIVLIEKIDDGTKRNQINAFLKLFSVNANSSKDSAIIALAKAQTQKELPIRPKYIQQPNFC